MSDEFWDSSRTGGHRKPDADPSLKGAFKALVRVPQGVPAPLWYCALWFGAVAACVTVGGLVGAVLGLIAGWSK
jgi:hypothetical protein